MTLRQKMCNSGVNTLRELICVEGGGGADRLIYVRSFTADKIDEPSAKNAKPTGSANTLGTTSASASTNSAEFIAPKYSANKETNGCH